MIIASILTFFPIWLLVIIGLLLLLALKDILQNRHTIQHNFPVVGHLRYIIERIGPELRQYIVANNREELPFNRKQRAWIYASAKKENNYQGFGTDQDIMQPGFVFIKPNLLGTTLSPGHPHHLYNSGDKNHYTLPSAKLIGGSHQRKLPYRPRSIMNVSAMSYGSLSARAVEALNKGSFQFGNYHNTGEGGLSPYHQNGADVVFHIGTAYFGVRDEAGKFSMEKLVRLCEQHPYIRMIEVKLSQGAKPGKGGVLPASKITREIAEIRHVPMGQDIISPPYHSAFDSVDGLIQFVESIAQATGLPVGIKSAVGKTDMWEELAFKMAESGSGPDFITIDGGEGGTGAAPPAFADHVSLPFVQAFSRVYKIFQKNNLNDKITFIASGKLGLPGQAVMAFSMGADIINVAREAMLSIGCIQAQICHTNRCPTGITTNNKWLESGIDPTLKSQRFHNYVRTFTKEMIEIAHAAGYQHPCQFTTDDVEISLGDNATTTLGEHFGYQKTIIPFDGIENLLECPHLGNKKEA
ncbi:glutamate synthase domain-containing protein 2 [Dyadobacter jejuensis]|uniref:Glutamate synthase domain-containing protein 2 n=1 Tax=Dyadobacter jejuensis TaxID=1082580 RepID=A0A316AKZ7_9BACT|nr:FMN-binding glutamate synthase family protein [Dyadobacter jejuensis]PWJ58211.1 glutamate synthase domain-containing protein 2 [Dyadobacter jejuensis]